MDFYELTTNPIEITNVARRVVPPECVATVTLDGYVRRFTRNKGTGEVRDTLYLVYEAYEPMAIKEMEKLIAAAKSQFEISYVGMVHRRGRLEIGETSVVISVAAPHPAAAFTVCDWLIKELKRTVPIWKKEVYADGEEWGFVLTPWLVGDRIGLHPVAVIFAILAGGHLFGFIGVLLMRCRWTRCCW